NNNDEFPEVHGRACEPPIARDGLNSLLRNSNFIAVPSNPNRLRKKFSRYRRYEKCIRLASFVKNTKVGGRTSACVPYLMRRGLRPGDGGGLVATASRITRFTAEAGIR